MTTPAQRRLIKDLEKINREGAEEFMASPLEDNLLIWSATIEGAEGTPWEGGLFTLKLQFSESYPNSPPKVKFLSKMFHPNIYNDGRICLDMLYNQWSPVYDVWALLTAIKSLLLDPNTQSPANMTASNIFKENKLLYEVKVREMVEKSLEMENEEQMLAQLQKVEVEKPPPEPLPKKKSKIEEKPQRKRSSLSMNSLSQLSSTRPSRLWASPGSVFRWQSTEHLVGLNTRYLHINDPHPAQKIEENHSESHSSRSAKQQEQDDSDNDQYEQYQPEEGQNQSEGANQAEQSDQGQIDQQNSHFQGRQELSQVEGQHFGEEIEVADNNQNSQHENNHEQNVDQQDNSEAEPIQDQQNEADAANDEDNDESQEEDSQEDGTGVGDRSGYQNEPREELEVAEVVVVAADQEIRPNDQ